MIKYFILGLSAREFADNPFTFMETIMKRNYTALHVAAGIIGAFTLYVDIWSNVEATFAQTKNYFDPTISAVIVVGLATSIVLACAYNSFRSWRILTGTILLIAFGLGSTFAILTTLSRVSDQRDTQLASIWKADQRWQELTKLESNVRVAASRECMTVDVGTKKTRGPACLALEQQLKLSTESRELREAELDSLGKRIHALIPAISIQNASIYYPCVLPIALYLMANWLLAFAIDGEKVEAEFETELKGRFAIEAKAKRYAQQFYNDHGRWPKWGEVAETLEVTPAVAKRIAKSFG